MNSNYINIINTALRFHLFPALLKPTDYWSYQKQRQLYRKSYRKSMILLDLVVIFISLVISLFLSEDFIVRIFFTMIILGLIGNLLKIPFSKDQKTWWNFLFLTSILFIVVIFFLSIFLNNFALLIIIFIPINHIISLLKSRKLFI